MRYTYTIVVLLLIVLGTTLTVSSQAGDLEPGLARSESPLSITIRVEADPDSEKIGSIEPGEEVTILEIAEDNWIRVEKDGLEGWIRSSKLVNIGEDDSIDMGDPLPPPTGPYPIGKTFRHWIDESREEIFTEEEDFRELNIIIWYPAEKTEDGEFALYRNLLAGPVGDELAAAFPDHPLTVLQNQLITVQSHAYLDAPLAVDGSPFPVVVMSHGHGALLEAYGLQAMELASHGYVVVGVNHSFFSLGATFADGDFISFTSGVEQLNDDTLDIVADDIIFAIDQLVDLNADDPQGVFTSGLDLERIGVFGHSMGGVAGIVAASKDERILAVLNEDGEGIPESASNIEQPMMFFSALFRHIPSAGPNFTALVRGFEHGSFNDNVLFVSGTGRVAPLRSVEIIRTYLVAFFDQYLKGIDQPLLNGSSDDFPEVEFEASNTE